MPEWLHRRGARASAPVALPAAEPEGYAGFKVVLDEPSPAPALGFDGFAEALAELITCSRAAFAAGIFGSWGSGKTTLMRAVQGRLVGDDVVTVWFNAWRYEKEPDLIIPLLDVLRDALRAKDRAWARDAAIAVGRAGRALLAGLKLSVGAIPGFRIDVEPGKMLESLRGNGPLSLYHAGYVKLQQAIARISGGGARRVVIFVDDLDRCLPETALELLESMKVLFAVPGCVFVAALDQEVVQTAITIKYGADSEISAADYIKKIFQVPFTLPQDGISDMHGYLNAVEASAGFGAAQRADFRDHVRPHLAQLAAAGPGNQREVKRLINSYVLQLKVMWLKLGDELDPDIVLALLCMQFRLDWQPYHDRLIAEPQVIQPLLRDAVQPAAGGQPPGALWLPGVAMPVPPSLLDYLGKAAWPLLHSADLRPYLAVTRSTWSAEPWIPQARIMAFQMRRSADEAQDGATVPESLVRDAQDLLDLIARRREPVGSLRSIRRDLEGTARQIVAALSESSPNIEARHARLTALLDRLDTVLRDYQQFAAASG